MKVNLEFELRYLLGDTPWDSGVTPPELEEFVEATAPGRALEFGCGIGTNAIYLADHGWQVEAIDFSLVAIIKARFKANRTGVELNFIRGDAAEASNLPGVMGPYDLGLDIGCFHALDDERRQEYADQLPGLIKGGGTYLLYSFLDQGEPSKRNWPKEADILSHHHEHFDLIEVEHGYYKDRASAWFTFRRRT